MVRSHALATFDYIRNFLPHLEDLDRSTVELVINTGSTYIAQLVGEPIIRKVYSEIVDYDNQVRVKGRHVTEIHSVKYDPTREFSGEDELSYVWIKPSPFICFMDYHYVPFRKKTVQIVYTAGKYRLDYYGDSEPDLPKDGEVWHNPSLNEFKVYDAMDDWVDIEEQDVLDHSYVNALIEAVLYNKGRIANNSVGVRSKSGGQVSTISNTTFEVRMPSNIAEILTGEVSLI